MTNLKSLLARTATAALFLTAAAATPALAVETIKMIAIDGYPARAMWVKEFSGYFLPEVNKRLAAKGNYKIEWQEAYGGAIVKPKGVLEGIKLGLGDIGVVTTVFHSSKLPLQGIAFVTPFISSDAGVVAKAVDEIAAEFPQMGEAFEKQNQVLLANGVVLDSYQVFSRDQVNGIADMNGKKVAGAGYNLRYLEGVGAAGVRGGLTNFYNMLQTGVVDQAMLWPEAAKTFKIGEVAPYMLKANLGAVNTKSVTINMDTWKKLPEEVRAVLKAVAADYRDRIAGIAMERAAASEQKFFADGGTIVELSAEQRATWAMAMPNIAAEWAEELEAKGIPAKDMLRAYMAKLKAAGQPATRDWTADLK
ncbi:C4-dicarboxylate TRAP transporter substrate-binding protein [Nisaea sp.]|uniref:C4-dicarboxylate TRAP transporter substrate-binding protein n=1 Tax=Nisaea sp. TaxID=2024842 RepID=UPI002B26F02F|nr:C4-dicarboxylate TRAP transporter substrate-binding protein [Nisaea sp.]